MGILTGLITGTLVDNCLALTITPSALSSSCALKGTMSADGRSIDATYGCPDGEEGEVVLTGVDSENTSKNP